jgi:hypothetical protein
MGDIMNRSETCSGSFPRARPRQFTGWRSCLVSLLLLPWVLASPSSAQDDLRESGTIDISQVQVAFLWGGNLGGGTLHYGGKSYDFTIGGLGVGGIGASSIEATGKVYNLDRLDDFSGAYGQARLGFAAGDESGGTTWLQNETGVYIELDTKRTGLMLSGGVDAIYIEFD